MSAKIELLKVAATLAAGAAANLPDDVKRGADGQLDPSQKAENLVVWELTKIFYGGLVANFNDKAAFPDPPPEAGVGNAAESVLNNEAIKGLLEKLAAKV